MKAIKLETLTNLGIIALCVVACLALVQRMRAGDGQPPKVAQGDVIENLAPHLPAGAKRALVVALSPDCGYCTRSMPFYKRLLTARHEANVPIIAVVHNEEELVAERAVMVTQDIAFDRVVPVDFLASKVTMTPLLMLVDREAKVLRLWTGQLKPEAEAEVLAVLGSEA